jgi:mRNA-degrading endonuclease toxin of MazEF toxin-antitoxin module
VRTSRFRFGQIVQATFHDKRRSTKLRPVLIIDDDDDYESTGEILVVPFTTSEPIPCEYYHIVINGDDPGSECAALPQRCWAKCDGAECIKVERLEKTLGYMPMSLVLIIREAYRRAYDDPDVHWW